MRALIPSITLLLFGLLTVGCGIRGSGVAAEETRTVDDFVGVVDESSIDVDVEARAGAASSVVVECDDNLIEHIQTFVEGQRLVVYQEPGSWLQPQTACRVVVVSGQLEDVEIAGSGDIEVWSESQAESLSLARVAGSGSIRVRAPVTAAELELRIEGSGDIDADRAEVDLLTAVIAGSGSIRVAEGEAATVDARIQGSGDIDLSEVVCADGHGSIEGSGSITVRCTESMDSYIGGSGDVVVYGDPASRDEVDEGSGKVVYR